MSFVVFADGSANLPGSLLEGSIHDVDLRHKGKRYDKPAVEVDQHIFDAGDLLSLDRMHGIHRETELIVYISLNQEDDCRDYYGDDGNCRTEIMIGTGFGKIRLVDDDRESLVSFTDQ